MTPVASSLLKAVGYDEEKEELRVRFHKGGSYVYRGVTRKMYDAMMNDASAGGYFIQNIKGRFECTKERSDG
jgi:hypothetical protein